VKKRTQSLPFVRPFSDVLLADIGEKLNFQVVVNANDSCSVHGGRQALACAVLGNLVEKFGQRNRKVVI
jgi:hypothetical protein